MTLIIALSDGHSEFWVAADTAGLNKNAGAKTRIAGEVTKAVIVRSGADAAIVAVSGIAELNGKMVLDIVAEIKDELIAKSDITRLLHRLKTGVMTRKSGRMPMIKRGHTRVKE